MKKGEKYIKETAKHLFYYKNKNYIKIFIINDTAIKITFADTYVSILSEKINNFNCKLSKGKNYVDDFYKKQIINSDIFYDDNTYIAIKQNKKCKEYFNKLIKYLKKYDNFDYENRNKIASFIKKVIKLFLFFNKQKDIY